jgi:hypothetical protein
MLSEELLRCRVCGVRLDEAPWGSDGMNPSFDLCPCCGAEFGYEDATPEGARRYRARWLASGAPWNDPDERPPDWNVEEQLTHIPEAFR